MVAYRLYELLDLVFMNSQNFGQILELESKSSEFEEQEGDFSSHDVF